MRRKFGLLVLLVLFVGLGDAMAQTRVITGRITHLTTGDPIQSARITVPGTTLSTFTDEDGTFSIGLPTGPVQLLIRALGFQRI